MSWSAVNAAFAVPEGGYDRTRLTQTNRGELYAADAQDRLHHSADGGMTWTALVTPGGPDRRGCLSIAVAPSDARVVHAGHHGGLLRSEDAGRSFQRAERGMDCAMVMALAGAADDPEALICETLTDQFRSTDRGRSWKKVASLEDPPRVAGTKLRDRRPGQSHGLTLRESSKETSISVDGGKTFASVPRGAGPPSVACLIAPAYDPAVIYAGTGSGCVFRSPDAGASWVSRFSTLSDIPEFDDRGLWQYPR